MQRVTQVDGRAETLTFKTNLHLANTPQIEDLPDAVPVVKFKKKAASDPEVFRECSCTARYLLWLRKGELKLVNKTDISSYKMGKNDLPPPVLDVAPLRDYSGTPVSDTIAACNKHGDFVIVRMAEQQDAPSTLETVAIGHNTSEAPFRILEWLSPTILVALAADGEMWAFDVPMLCDTYARGGRTPVDVQNWGKRMQLRPKTPIVPNFVSTTFDQATGTQVVAVSQAPNPQSITLYSLEGSQKKTEGSFSPTGTPVCGAHWMGNPVYPDYRDILLTVSDAGRSIMFWKVSGTGTQKLFHVRLEHDGVWNADRKWLIDAEGDTAVISAGGCRNILFVTLSGPPKELTLSISERAVLKKGDETLCGIAIPACSQWRVQSEGLDMCWISTDQFSRSQLGDMHPAASTAPPTAAPATAAAAQAPAPIPVAAAAAAPPAHQPKPPATQPPPPPQPPAPPADPSPPQPAPPAQPEPPSDPAPPATPAPVPAAPQQPQPPAAAAARAQDIVEVMAPEPVKAKPYVKPEFKATALHPLSFSTLPVARGEATDSFGQLTSSLEKIQALLKSNHEQLNSKLGVLEEKLHDQKHAAAENHEATMLRAKHLSSDLQQSAQAMYFNPVAKEIREVMVCGIIPSQGHMRLLTRAHTHTHTHTAQSTINDEIVELGEYLSAPATAMLDDLEKSNKEGALAMQYDNTATTEAQQPV